MKTPVKLFISTIAESPEAKTALGVFVFCPF
nr:MAG TPA: hypothetical protein [Caudoviricetes sp.]